MRGLFFSVSSFTFTMIVSLIAFAFTAIYYPVTMHYFLSQAEHLRDEIVQLNLPGRYMVWVDLLFLPANQIVLVGYSIAVRLILALIGYILFPTEAAPRSADSSRSSPFSRWG